MNHDKIREVYTNFALELLNKEIRDFVVFQAPPHLQELYTRLVEAFEHTDDAYSPPTVYSWKSDNPYAGRDEPKAEQWEAARLLLMKNRT